MSKETNEVSRRGLSNVTLLLGLLSILSTTTNIASSAAPTQYSKPSTTTTKTGRTECLGLDEDEKLDQLISNHNTLFVVFPAKAAGTTMKRFTKKCQPVFHNYQDNVVNAPIEGKIRPFILSRNPSSVISSHLYTDRALIDIVKHATRQTLIIYIHREETSRIVSAIKYVFYKSICAGRKKDICNISESALIRDIKELKSEIAVGASKLLTCASYGAIDEHAPDLVFMNYKQADKLQKLIAKHHCPQMFANFTSVRMNTHISHSQHKPMILTERFGEIELVDWLDLKKDTLEWTLSMRRDASCQASTKRMENAMFGCPDETIQFFSEPLHV